LCHIILLPMLATADAWVGWPLASVTCLCVCLCVNARRELSTSNLVDIYNAWHHALGIHWSWDQKVKGYDYRLYQIRCRRVCAGRHDCLCFLVMPMKWCENWPRSVTGPSQSSCRRGLASSRSHGCRLNVARRYWIHTTTPSSTND